ncbi:hypothetical protein V8G54_033194 [Vigna mungo]|uniref:Uncharacterized protein n=1 Tax=Vigna mungo TaxID=3915 RepID=A0AAQ3RHE6_VIGMU
MAQNQEKGLEGSSGFVDGDQDSVNRGKIGRREEFLQDVLKAKKEGKITKKHSDGGENSNNWEKERETNISAEDEVDHDHEGVVVTITSGTRLSEVADLSVDCFAAIKGQDRREENRCEGEVKNENCDEDIVVVVEKVVKVAIYRGDNGVGCGVYVKTVKEGLQYNVQRKQLDQHNDDDEEIEWSDQQDEQICRRFNECCCYKSTKKKPLLSLMEQKESTILSYRPPRKLPYLNRKAVASGFSSYDRR